MQQLFGIPIGYIMLILEVIVLLVLVVGWIYGSRRRDFNLHHKAVYFIILVHLLTVGFWMIPRAIERVSIMLGNPLLYWYQIIHDFVGMFAIVVGVLLVVVYFVKTRMRPTLLKHTKSLMLLTVVTWIIAFVLGVYWFLLGYF